MRIGGLRRIGLLAVVATLFTMIALANPAAAATTYVDVTVDESLPVSTPGTVIADRGLGCLGGSVDTTDSTGSSVGNVTFFSGTKTFNCPGGTLVIQFSAVVAGCASSDHGSWSVVGGTGAYSGASGGGVLVGTYQGGDACSNSGIHDRWRGVVRTP